MSPGLVSMDSLREERSAYRRKGIVVPTACLLLALVAATVASGAVGRSPLPVATTNVSASIELSPPIARLGQQVSIVVSHVRAPSLQVLALGATDKTGNPLGWRGLRLVDGTWRGTIPAPGLRGIYPIVLRVDPGTPAFGSQAFLQVLTPGTRSRPSFESPDDVVRWWVQAVPRATLVAMKAWPRPGFDRRDPRLHRLFVVAYGPPGSLDVTDQLGMFITAYREGYQGGWRLLEATIQP